MSFFDEMAALAAQFTSGEMFSDAILTRSTTASFDPVTGTVTSGTETLECRAVVAKTVIRGANGVLERVTTVTLDTEPQEGDKLAIGNDSYKLGAVTRVAPNGQAIIYKAVAL